MRFSEKLKQSNQLCAFSPDGKHFAHVFQCRLVVRPFNAGEDVTVCSEGDDDTLLYVCADVVTFMEWSPDSLYILCGLQRKSQIQVWSVNEPTWSCKLNHGAFGLTATRWSPDSRHILAASDLKLRITIWSLVNKGVSYIEYPKYTTKGLAFTNDGKYMAVAEHRDYQDNICIFSCADSWDLLNRFPVDTHDMADIKFSPNGYMLAIWDSKIEYKVVVYSLDGRLLFSYSANDIALLGVKTVSWSPCNQYLYIGSYDQQIRVINTMIWKPVCNMPHVVKITDPNVIVYEEVDYKSANYDTSYPRFIVHNEPVQISSLRPDVEKPNPKLGVGTITCCHGNENYMATKNDNMPHVVWIWDTTTLDLDTLIMFRNPIKTFVWHPTLSHLAVCTGNDSLYVWCPEGCIRVPVPDVDDVTNVAWHVSGNALLVMGKGRMCVAHLNTKPTRSFVVCDEGNGHVEESSQS